ncbi:enoyl-CoA hydratase-related protein [Roseivivax sp. CAU 1753]
MPDLVHRHLTGGVAILEISNPPANVVSGPVRAALSSGLATAIADSAVNQIVIAAAGRDFCTGLDTAERPGSGRTDAPSLQALCRQIEDAPKPVIVAIQGQAMSSGAELALAAHYRIAASGAQIAFPESQVGLVPRAGSTQRLPRLLGAGAALEMLVNGRTHAVARPPARALFDDVVTADLRSAALAFCRDLQASGGGPRPSSAATAGLRDPMAYQAAIAKSRETLKGRPQRALHELVDCIEAAQLLPFEAGLAREAEAYHDLVDSDQAQALRHIFMAERRLAQGAAKEAALLPEQTRIAILGGGPLATQLVIVALDHGLGVNWGTRDPSKLRQGVTEVTETFKAHKARGTVTEAKLTDVLGRLRLGESHKMAEDVSAAIIAARGQGAVPLPPGVPRLKAIPDPVDEVALRFASPLVSTRFAEVLVGPKAASGDVTVARGLLRRMGKLPLGVATRGPSVTDRMMNALQGAADALVDLGEDPYGIDRAVRLMRWPRPPFEARDLRGLAEFAGQRRAQGARNWSAVLLQSGRQGLSTGRGFYLHHESGLRNDAAVTALLDDMRPPAPQPRSHDALAELLLAVLANEGAHILADRAITRPWEIDVAMCLGQSFPRWRGGPMMAADLAGLFHLKRALDAIAHPDRRLWDPHPMWAELIKNGKRFTDLNG